jgi:hypothetical protein
MSDDEKELEKYSKFQSFICIVRSSYLISPVLSLKLLKPVTVWSRDLLDPGLSEISFYITRRFIAVSTRSRIWTFS